MKCPRLVDMTILPHGIEEAEFGDCIEGECAWWRDDVQMCSKLATSMELCIIKRRLADIAKEITLVKGR